jgi:acyl-CoA synthetase (NDP forming)
VALAAVVSGPDGEPRIVGIGRYRRVDGKGALDASSPRAEVAFTVEDAYQGRGIGTLLLEHLAEVGRASGVGQIDADVMADNSRMLQVFAESGFVVKETLEARVFHVTFPTDGGVSMLSQSGALGIAMLDRAVALHMGIADFVSIGNKADVSANDLLSYWADDPKTRVIALYLESFGNPRKFARIAPDVARKKPIVAVKSGRSAAGTCAALSHSAALASLDVGVDALFAQAGVVRTNTLEELFDVVALLSTQPLPEGPRVGVVTNARGPGILLADACEARGLALPELARETQDALRAFLPGAASVKNPVDMIASATPEQFARAIEAVGGMR